MRRAAQQPNLARARTAARGAPFRPWTWAVCVVVVCAVGAAAARWYVTKRSLAWPVRRGLRLLEEADTPSKVRAALERWELETRSNWAGRQDDFVEHLFKERPLSDPRVRWMLTCVAGADYGTRREDWQRWYESRRRLAVGQPPRMARKEVVRFDLRWTTPIGLTGWFSTIQVLDGQIYVASLGTAFDDVEDEADGVIRVDGATGAAEYIFIPPAQTRGPRDVIGVAACDEGFFVACYNGVVFAIDPAGALRWRVHVGDPVVAMPLAIDFNRDGSDDVIVATRGGKVVALSGRQGKTAWATSVARAPAGETMLGATLAMSPALGRGEPGLLVTMPTGQVRILGVRSGRVFWDCDLPAGTIGGALSVRAESQAGPPAYVADRAATVWSLPESERSLDAVRWQALNLRRDDTLIAGLRTMRVADDPNRAAGPLPPLLLACPTGDYRGPRGAVCALGAEGLRWRYPLDGAVWGTPAVADLNGDGQPELVVGSIAQRENGQLGGVVTILSAAGHCLHRVTLQAPVECSPVVADVDGDNRLDVLIADQSGYLYCFGTGGYGPVEWGSFGGDSHNTRNPVNAYSFGQTPFGYQRQWQPP